jgi:hypothetical protein
MSLHPGAIPPVPEETRRMAPAAFPRGNLYMRLRDELGAIYDDHLFASLFPARGQPAASAREALAATAGAEGRHLLQAVEAATDLPWLRQVSAVQTLRQVWAEQYTDPPGPLRWREVRDRAPAAKLIASPTMPTPGTVRNVTCSGSAIRSTSPKLVMMTNPIASPRC